MQQEIRRMSLQTCSEAVNHDVFWIEFPTCWPRQITMTIVHLQPRKSVRLCFVHFSIGEKRGASRDQSPHMMLRYTFERPCIAIVTCKNNIECTLRDRLARGLAVGGKTLDSGGERICILASGLRSDTSQIDWKWISQYAWPEFITEFAAVLECPQRARLPNKASKHLAYDVEASMATRRPLSLPVRIKPPLSNCC